MLSGQRAAHPERMEPEPLEVIFVKASPVWKPDRREDRVDDDLPERPFVVRNVRYVLIVRGPWHDTQAVTLSLAVLTRLEVREYEEGGESGAAGKSPLVECQIGCDALLERCPQLHLCNPQSWSSACAGTVRSTRQRVGRGSGREAKQKATWERLVLLASVLLEGGWRVSAVDGDGDKLKSYSMGGWEGRGGR